MAAAVSQLCVWQGQVVHSSGFISTRAVKVEQISPLFHLYLFSTSFSSQKSIRFCQPGMPSKLYRYLRQ